MKLPPVGACAGREASPARTHAGLPSDAKENPTGVLAVVMAAVVPSLNHVTCIEVCNQSYSVESSPDSFLLFLGILVLLVRAAASHAVHMLPLLASA